MMDTSKRSYEALMKFNVVSCNGVSIPKVQEPITMLRVTPHETGKEKWFSFAGFPRAFCPNLQLWYLSVYLYDQMKCGYLICYPRIRYIRSFGIGFWHLICFLTVKSKISLVSVTFCRYVCYVGTTTMWKYIFSQHALWLAKNCAVSRHNFRPFGIGLDHFPLFSLSFWLSSFPA